MQMYPLFVTFILDFSRSTVDINAIPIGYLSDRIYVCKSFLVSWELIVSQHFKFSIMRSSWIVLVACQQEIVSACIPCGDALFILRRNFHSVCVRFLILFLHTVIFSHEFISKKYSNNTSIYLHSFKIVERLLKSNDIFQAKKCVFEDHGNFQLDTEFKQA